MQTISWAQTMIKRNDDNPHTIWLAEGTYSPSLNNQKFPLNVKHGISYTGVTPEETVLDAENLSSVVENTSKQPLELTKLTLNNMTLRNGKYLKSRSGGINMYQTDLLLSNVILENMTGNIAGAINSYNGSCILSDVIIRNTTGLNAIQLVVEYSAPNPQRNDYIVNTILENNNPIPGVEDFAGGKAMRLGGHDEIPGIYKATLVNCLIKDNYNATNLPGFEGAVGCEFINNEVDMINCTFSDNEVLNNTGSVINLSNSELNVYNSILWDNDGYSFFLSGENSVNIYNSLIEGGDNSIGYFEGCTDEVNWLDGNLDTPPLWLLDGDNLYSLSDDSPCIDAGTLILPEGIDLPDYDLAGNPRFVGDGIDMGCYEFQGSISVIDELIPSSNRITLFNHPNPFNPSTNISFQISEISHKNVEVEIYNIKGQKVVTLSDPAKTDCIEGRQTGITYSVTWHGTDQSGKQVASGIYFYKLNVENSPIGKMVLIK